MPESLKRYRVLAARYLGPYRLRVTALATVLATATALTTYNPQFVRRFIDGAQAGAPIAALVRLGLAFVALGLLQRGLQVIAAYLSSDLGWRATNDLRVDLAAHCLSLDLPFHKSHSPGHLIERIDGDVQAMAGFFADFVLQVVGSLLLLVGILIALYLADWRLGLGLTLLAVGALAVLLRLRTHAVLESTNERRRSADLFGFIEERLAALEDIRANGGGAYVMRRFLECLREFARARRLADVRAAAFWLATEIMLNVGDTLAFSLGAALLLAGRASLGTVYLLVTYVRMLVTPVQNLSRQLRTMQSAAAGLGRVAELLAVRREVVDGPREDLPTGPLAVEFSDVSFAYEDGEQSVLHGLHFRLAAGASVGLLGRTGSGKTTLSRLLFRLYDPTAGAISLAGVPLPELTLAALRRHVAMVTQEVQLFQASVRDNVTLFDPTVPDATVVGLLEEVGLGQWLARQPDGIATELAAGGGGLSAGEAQLLAFARVFLRDPGLVILDEPSSRLDPATERLIERAMDRLLRGRTAIVIAHRLGTVQRLDQVMVMDEGRIVEHGPRLALAGDATSHFARLLRTGLEDSFA